MQNPLNSKHNQTPITPRPGVQKIFPYIPGKGAHFTKDYLRLASNENTFGASPLAQQRFLELSQNFHRYPDADCHQLKEQLHETYNIPASHIICGNGSDELISLIIRTFSVPNDTILGSEYGFAMYKIAALANDCIYVEAPAHNYGTNIEALLHMVTATTKIVIIANPNNPTGTQLSVQELRYLRQNLREDILLIIDSAYADYIEDDTYTAGHDLVLDFENVIVLRTFSKLFALAGLRLGWADCGAYLAACLNRARNPFNTNLIAQDVAIAALKDTTHQNESRDKTRTIRNDFMQFLHQHQLSFIPSQTNFLMVKFEETQQVYQYLLDHHIIVRPLEPYGLYQFLRITLGRQDEMDRVKEILQAYVS